VKSLSSDKACGLAEIVTQILKLNEASCWMANINIDSCS
jgi:hypothetical protein